MDATLANFRTLFPEFNDPVLSDARVELYLEQAREIHSCSGTAQLYLAAHLAALDLSNAGMTPGEDVGGGGFGVTQKVGDLSVTYKTPKAGDEGFMQTFYGRKYVTFRDAAKTKLTVGVYG